MIRKTLALSFVLLACLALPGFAEMDGPPPPAPKKLADQPGYFPFAELGLSGDKASVEINLQGPLLRMIAGAAGQEDPDFAAVISSLQSIQVRVLPISAMPQPTIKGKVDRATRWLEDRGWMPTLRVKENGEEAYIYLKEVEGKIQGLTLLALDADEATVINIVGRIDPEQIVRLGQTLHMPQLEKAAPPKPKKDKP